MRTLLYVLTVVVLTPRPLAAQNTTSDGVHALIRGDYETAVRILRPLAEDAVQPDPVAQFFMATLYESGRGVATGAIRACGLYLKAATTANPLTDQARELAAVMQEMSGPGVAQSCLAASRDWWGDLPNASFTLAPSHSLTIDEKGATVRYHGTEHHTIITGGPNTVFLPIRYTPLDVTRPTAGRRHFVQFFGWRQDAIDVAPAWTLGWSVSEVVGADLVPVTGDSRILTGIGPEPPLSYDVGTAAGVRVDANGEAMWVILTGTAPRGGVIPVKEPR
jgi:hypothetical protein